MFRLTGAEIDGSSELSGGRALDLASELALAVDWNGHLDGLRVGCSLVGVGLPLNPGAGLALGGVLLATSAWVIEVLLVEVYKTRNESELMGGPSNGSAVGVSTDSLLSESL